MAQADYNLANQSGQSFRVELNSTLSAILSLNSGGTAPASAVAYTLWADTTTGLLKIRDGGTSAFITIGALGSVNLGLAALASPSFTGTPLAPTASAGTNTTQIATTAFVTGQFLSLTGGTVTGNITLNAQSDVRFADADSSNFVALQAPATVASNVTFTLPSADGTNGQVLSTNGTGTLSFASVTSSFAGTSDVNGVNTTGTVTASTTSLVVASATGIAAGMFVVGEGIAPGTTVSSIASTTVTLSANANATLIADPVTFYSASKILTPAVVGSQLCRAWVNFNGTGTVAIRASFNVSSITDNAVGDYTVNFTTALADANYVIVGTTSTDTGAIGVLTSFVGDTDFSKSTSLVKIMTISTNSSLPRDYNSVNVAIFR